MKISQRINEFMNTEEYIENVLKHIQNKSFVTTIRQELEGHIDDRVFYYEEIGYDKDTAKQKAMEHMGDADKVGEQMNILHDYKKHKKICITGLVLFTLRALLIRYAIDVNAIMVLFNLHSYDDRFALSCIDACIFMIIAFIVYKYALVSRCRVVLFLQGLVGFIVSYYFNEIGMASFNIVDFTDINALSKLSNSDILFLVAGALILILGVSFFVYSVMCLTCSVEVTALIKGRPNTAILKRYDKYERFLFIFLIISISLAIAFTIIYFKYSVLI